MPVTELPKNLNSIAVYNIILAGGFTEDQSTRIRQEHSVRHSMIRRLCAFYVENNIMCENVQFDESLLMKYAKEESTNVGKTSTVHLRTKNLRELM